MMAEWRFPPRAAPRASKCVSFDIMRLCIATRPSPPVLACYASLPRLVTSSGTGRGMMGADFGAARPLLAFVRSRASFACLKSSNCDFFPKAQAWYSGIRMLEGLPPNNAAHKVRLVSDERRARAVADLIGESFEAGEA